MSSKKRDVIFVEEGDDDDEEAESTADATAHEETSFRSDDDMPEESSEERLSWSTDEHNKEHSFSDWKIIISISSRSMSSKSCTDENNDENCNDMNHGESVTYHVYKAIMATGPRRCEYFVRLFEDKNDNGKTFSCEPSSSQKNNTSRIELNPLEAKAFPEFLDYVYMATDSVDDKKKKQVGLFTTDNATAIYSLAKYFDVRRLRHEVKKFILQDFRQSETCGTYYEHAKILQEESILEAFTKYWRDRPISFIQEESQLLQVTDAQFWLDLMEYQRTKKNRSCCLSKHWSTLIARFCRIQKVSPEVFQQLTDERYLECVDPKAAIQLLYLERQLLLSIADDDDDNNVNKDGSEVLSNLQKRCVKSMARCDNDNDNGLLSVSLLDARDILPNVPPRVLRQVIFGNTTICQPEPPQPPPVLREIIFGKKVRRRCEETAGF